MKKNLLALIALVLSVVGLVFGILSFVKVQKSGSAIDALTAQNEVLKGNIEDLADAIDLSVDTSVDQKGNGGISITDMEPIAVSFSSKQTYNLKSDGSKKERFAQMTGYTLYLDKNADDFSNVQENLKADHAQIDGIISGVISNHTYEEAQPDVVVEKALKKINKLLNSKAAVQLVLEGYVKQ